MLKGHLSPWLRKNKGQFKHVGVDQISTSLWCIWPPLHVWDTAGFNPWVAL